MILYFLLMLTACQPSSTPPSPPADSGKEIRYLALGDSYTIGTAIGKENSYASLLADSLRGEGHSVDLDIIAKNGWTTANLIQGIEEENPESNYDLVSLLIGVNNQFQGRSITEYRKQFRQLAETALEKARGDTGRVFILSIPDYGVTPYGKPNQQSIAKDIDEFNAVNREVSDSLHLAYFNITPLSRLALNGPDLVAKDGLHFSEEMHRLWVESVFSRVGSMVR